MEERREERKHGRKEGRNNYIISKIYTSSFFAYALQPAYGNPIPILAHIELGAIE